MTTHRIKKGSWRATPNTTALRYVRNGAKWRVRFNLNTGEVEQSTDPTITWTSSPPYPVPSTHIKLLGLYWAGWNVWPRMREAWRAHTPFPFWEMQWKYRWTAISKALRQIPAWTHGNSARVIAAWESRGGYGGYPVNRGVALRTYYYLGGKGAVTTGSPVAGEEVAWLIEDPKTPGWTEWGEVMIATDCPGLGVWGKHIEAKKYLPIPRRPWFFGLTMAHARNGAKGSGREHAPCDLEFEIKRVAL